MPSFQKQKKFTKIKCLEEKEKHHVQDFLKIVYVIFSSSPNIFVLVGVFGFLYGLFSHKDNSCL